jgi:hypothetical protein
LVVQCESAVGASKAKYWGEADSEEVPRGKCEKALLGGEK